MTDTLFPLTTVAAMAACFLLVALASAGLVARWRPALASGSPPPTAWIDGLRGLAAALVLMNHVPLVIANHLHLAPTIDPEATRWANYLGVVGVQLFFCITGFLFAGKILGSRNVDWTDFFVRRIRRLVPAYALAVLAALVVGAVVVDADLDHLRSALAALPHMMSFGIFVLPAVEGFDMGRLLGVNWTLAIEWRFYAVLPLLFALRRSGHMNGPLALLFFTLLLVPVLGAGIWLYFIVGAAATLLPRAVPARALRAPLALLAAGAALSMALNWEGLASHKVAQGLHVAVLFVSLCLLGPRWPALRAVTALGTISYSLYLLHMTVLFVLFGLCHRFLFDVTALPAAGFALLGGLGVALSVLLAALSCEHVEQRFMSGGRPPEGASGAAFSPVVTRDDLMRDPPLAGQGERRRRHVRLVGGAGRKKAAAQRTRPADRAGKTLPGSV
ncbi:acyltransferase family protein [Variovorax sp. PvP013]|uniref:acyltransferase family protein n=1 Tax=Variovorax sp. PvP013 TaxID=3156435 RepID=UPI003D21BA84